MGGVKRTNGVRTGKVGTMRGSSIIKRVECTRAEELLDALSPRHSNWRDEQSSWVFRGHANSEWLLRPTSLRPETLMEFVPGAKPKNFDTNRTQIRAEFDALWNFFRRADTQGLPLPEDSQLFRMPEGWLKHLDPFLTEGREAAGRLWPPDQWLSLAALAQHYGVPTRLLDWARNSAVAAYFAASEAAVSLSRGNPEGISHMAVWALNWQRVCDVWPAKTQYQAMQIRVLIVTAPRASNPNLHAQGGMFTVERVKASELDVPPRREPLDVVLLRADRKDLKGDAPVMYRFELPLVEAPKLLRLLKDMHVSAESVYPGFRGVVEGMKDQRLWDRPPKPRWYLPV